MLPKKLLFLVVLCSLEPLMAQEYIESKLSIGFFRPNPKKFVIVWFENQNTNGLLNPNLAPFINSEVLPISATVIEHYGTVQSQPNYIVSICGDNRGIVSNSRCLGCVSGEDNLVSALDRVGKSTVGYFGGITEGVCPTEDITGSGYVTRHNPLISLAYVVRNPQNPRYCEEHHRPLSKFQDDLDRGGIPDFSIVVPSNFDNMHDRGIRSGDDWLKTFLPGVLKSALYQKGDLVVVLNWDEGVIDAGPTIFVLISPYVKKGEKSGLGYQSTTRGNQVSVFKFTAKVLLGADAPMYGDAVKTEIPDYGDLLDPFRLMFQRSSRIFW